MRQDKKMGLLAHGVMIILSLLAILPFWLLISASFTDETYAIREGYRFFPAQLSVDVYAFILKEWGQIGRAYLVTIVSTVIGTCVSIFITAGLAYGLSRRYVPGVKVFMFLVLFTMLFNGGLVPTYFIYTNVLHIKNTIWALIVPGLLMNGFNVILAKNYMATNIPGELMEAAQMDGCGELKMFFRIVLPLSLPILATIGLLSAVAYWNDWTNGLYYITNERLYSIQNLLNRMNENVMFMANNSSEMAGVDMSQLPSATIRMAIAVVGILPIIAAYPFFQKYFAKGITIGAVKG